MNREISKSELRPGDHIVSYRNVHTSIRHGIYVEDNTVIHFTKTSQSNQSCSVCNQTNSAPGVVRSCLDCFLQGHGLYLHVYNVSSAHSITSRIRSSQPRDASNDVVVQRANEMLTDTNSNVFENSKDFSIYCTTGKKMTRNSTKAKVKNAVKGMAGIVSVGLLAADVLGQVDNIIGSSSVQEEDEVNEGEEDEAL